MTYSPNVANTLEKVVTSVNKEIPNVVSQIILYGSYARGDYSPESDLDIMLLMNCNHDDVGKFKNTICKIASRIGLEDDIEISMTMQDKNTFMNRSAILPFYRNVLREGVTLYEP